MDSLVELFCDVDDFCQEFMPAWESQLLASGRMVIDQLKNISQIEHSRHRSVAKR